LATRLPLATQQNDLTTFNSQVVEFAQLSPNQITGSPPPPFVPPPPPPPPPPPRAYVVGRKTLKNTVMDHNRPLDSSDLLTSESTIIPQATPTGQMSKVPSTPRLPIKSVTTTGRISTNDHMNLSSANHRDAEMTDETFALNTTNQQIKKTDTSSVPYICVTDEEFEALRRRGQFIEWGVFNRALYGTSQSTVRKTVEDGKVCCITLRPDVSFIIAQVLLLLLSSVPSHVPVC
uniref:Guanylate kinase-like domain-containing protein n=1 Tax=Echinostoma caproni TaxID=27848 RepID=A0A183B3L9_9TREM